MADGPASPDQAKPAPAAAETNAGQGTENKNETQNNDKSVAERVTARAKGFATKLKSIMSSKNSEAGLKAAAAGPDADDTQKATPPSDEVRAKQDAILDDASLTAEQRAQKMKATQEPQSSDVQDSGTKILDAQQTTQSEDSSSPSAKKDSGQQDDADLKDSLPTSDWEEYKMRADKIAKPSRRWGGMLPPSTKEKNQYTNARQDLKREYSDKRAAARADQDANASSAEGQEAVSAITAAPSSENNGQSVADAPGALTDNASAEDLRKAFDAPAADAAIPDSERLPDSANATSTTDTTTTEKTSPEAADTPLVPETVDEVLDKFKESPSATDPVAEAEAKAKAEEARRGTDERYQELVKKMIETDGDPTRMSIEDQRELLRYQEARLQDWREGLKAADGSVPIETAPTGPAKPEDILKASGITSEQLAEMLNSDKGQALAEAMQESPEQAQAILKEIIKAQEMQTQLEEMFKANGWPFDGQKGMAFALGGIAAQLANEMNSNDADVVKKSSKKLTILRALLITLGIPLIVAGAAIAAEAAILQAAGNVMKQ